MDFSNITLMDNLETKEAEALYRKKRKIYLLYLIPVILDVVAIILLSSAFISRDLPLGFASIQLAVSIVISPIASIFSLKGVFGLIFIIISIILWIVFPKICRNILKPYKELMQLTKMNDQIRHDEKVRYKEKIRLQNEYSPNTSPSRKEIEEALQIYRELKNKNKE